MSQVKIDFLVTGNLSSLHKQVQTLNAELMAVAGTMTAVDRSMSNIDLQAANAQFGRMMTTSGQFTQQMVTMKTSTDLFADALNRQQLTMRQSFAEARKYVTGREGLIKRMARQQVMMQNSIVMPKGVSASGAVTAGVYTPTGLDNTLNTQLRTANKSWEIFNATAQQGATQMVNWGKNTQWAGRQLMVGFTVPLMMAGGLAAKTFKELDQELVRLQKVYGSGFSFGEDFQKQSEMIRESAMVMVKDMAQAYGQAGTETAGLMADLAATGFEGQDLMRMTEQTTKLATLGEVDRQQAMKATVALQSAFKMSTDEVADSVLFLNAVENQTSASLQDLVEAIPRAGTVVEGLGGSVEDLALYMVAFREGGISAAEGANALKSGLSSIIAPPKAAVEFMKEFGINLPKIVQQNAGELTPTLMAFQKELKGLDDLAQQQVITKLFGKYQFARMNAFFNNLGAQGSQTQKVFDLMGSSMEDLGKLADQEVAAQAESVSGKWDRAWETFKVSISEVGEDILKLGTMILNVFNSVFGFLSENKWAMDLVKYLAMAGAAIGPVIMLMGLFGNMLGMIAKGGLRLVNIFKVISSGGGISKTFEMLTADSVMADSAVDKLTGSMYDTNTAQEVLRQGIMELAASMEALGATSVESSAQMVSAFRAAGAAMTTAKSAAAGRHIPVQSGTLSAIPGMEGGTQRSHFFPKSGTSTDYYRTLGLALGMDASAAENLIKSGQTPNWGRGFQMFPGSIVGNQTAGGGLPIFTGSTSKINSEAPAYNPQSYARITAAQTAIDKGSPELKAAAKRLNDALIAGDTVAINQHYADFKALYESEAMQAAQAIEARTRQIIDTYMNQYASGIISAEEAFILSHRDAAMAAGYDVGVGGVGSSGIGKGQAATDSIYAASLVDPSLRLYMSDLDDTASQQAAAMNRVTSASDKFVSTLSLSDSSAKKVASALNTAATETLGFANVTVSQMEMEGRQFVVATDQAGNLIREASFAMVSSGKAGVSPSARALSDKQFADLSAAATRAAVGMGAAANGAVVLEGALVSDTSAMKTHTTSTLADTGAENAETGANLRAVESENAETAANMLAANQARARAAVAGVPISQAPIGRLSSARTAIGSGFSRMASSTRAPMYAGGALMGGAMLGSMMLPEGGASNIANMTMMGAGVGGMLGPWGMAIGGAAGLITGGLSEAFKSAQEEAKRQAEIAAANWESEFGKIDIGQELASQLKLGKLDTFKIPTIDLSGSGTDLLAESEKFKSSIAEGMKEEIENVRKMDDEEAAAYGKRLYTNLVAAGADAQKALLTAQQVLYQGDKTAAGVGLPAEVVKIDNEKKAEQLITKQLENIAKSSMVSVRETISSSGFLSSEELNEAGKNGALAYYNGLQEAFETGAINQDKYFSKMLTGFDSLTDSISSGKLASAWEAISGDPEAMDYLSSTLDTTITSYEDLKSALEGLPAERMQQILEGWSNGAVKGLGFSDNIINSFRDLGAATQIVNSAQTEYLASVREANPAVAGLAIEYMELAHVESIEEATLMALSTARREYNIAMRESAMEASFLKKAYKYLPDEDGLEKTNLNQLQRQQEREIEALEESEADKLEALEKAAEKRERLIEREINQTERQYDKEIREIENAEEKRQEQFENEQERFARRQEMRNMEISYQEAVAGGDLFEAARIRMDINATRKQREAEDREEKRQEKADKKIRILEKEKNQELRILNKKLRAEQRANEKAIESAQEASEAKLEAAMEANEKELRDAEKTNASIVKNQGEANADLKKLWDILLTGNMKRFENYADELGLKSNKRVELMMNFAEKEFGYLPGNAEDAIKKAIVNGNWDTIGELIQLAARGVSKEGLSNFVQSGSTGVGPGIDSPGRGYDARAEGGFISGPGTGTSDSIPARLSNGEYVIRQRAVSKYGKSFLDELNSTSLPSGSQNFAGGGLVGPGIGNGMAAGIYAGMFDMVGQQLGNMFAAAQSQSSGSSYSGTASPGDAGKYSGTFFDSQQLKNAAIIASVGKNMGASRRDIITALATAMTESSLHNYRTAVDHDSLGLFQQRPSMGWGTPKQITNPKYASRKFYQALFGISNRHEMSIGDAAQAVQRSAYPERYQTWVDEARAILKATSFSDQYVKPWVGPYGYSRTFSQHNRQGVDISMPLGTPLKAVTGGSLTNQPFAFGSYGNWYTLDSGDLRFVYAHLDRDKAMSGSVQPGKIIGYSGNTGNSFGPHLHFEARRNGSFSDQIDPARLNIPGLSSGGRINYDNTIANLHRGETVLTAPLTRKLEDGVAGGGGNTYNLDIDIHNPTSNVDVKKAVLEALREKDIKMGRNRRVN